MAEERLNAQAWAFKCMGSHHDAHGGWAWYPKNWAELAEAEGYYVWDTEFLGSEADFQRYERYYNLLRVMFEPETFLLETGDSRMFIVFDSACDAIKFRFELAALDLT